MLTYQDQKETKPLGWDLPSRSSNHKSVITINWYSFLLTIIQSLIIFCYIKMLHLQLYLTDSRMVRIGIGHHNSVNEMINALTYIIAVLKAIK